MRMKAFRSQPNTHEICIAPSGRAKCRKCKGMVAKGSVRIATTAFVRPGRATMFVRHACCGPQAGGWSATKRLRSLHLHLALYPE